MNLFDVKYKTRKIATNFVLQFNQKISNSLTDTFPVPFELLMHSLIHFECNIVITKSLWIHYLYRKFTLLSAFGHFGHCLLLDISRTRTRMDIKSLRQKLNQTRHRQVWKGRTHTRMHLELSTSNIFFEHFLEHDRNDVHLNIYYYEFKGKAPQISTVYVHERSWTFSSSSAVS